MYGKWSESVQLIPQRTPDSCHCLLLRQSDIQPQKWACRKQMRQSMDKHFWAWHNLGFNLKQNKAKATLQSYNIFHPTSAISILSARPNLPSAIFLQPPETSTSEKFYPPVLGTCSMVATSMLLRSRHACTVCRWSLDSQYT